MVNFDSHLKLICFCKVSSIYITTVMPTEFEHCPKHISLPFKKKHHPSGQCTSQQRFFGNGKLRNFKYELVEPYSQDLNLFIFYLFTNLGCRNK